MAAAYSLLGTNRSEAQISQPLAPSSEAHTHKRARARGPPFTNPPPSPVRTSHSQNADSCSCLKKIWNSGTATSKAGRFSHLGTTLTTTSMYVAEFVCWLQSQSPAAAAILLFGREAFFDGQISSFALANMRGPFLALVSCSLSVAVAEAARRQRQQEVDLEWVNEGDREREGRRSSRPSHAISVSHRQHRQTRQSAAAEMSRRRRAASRRTADDVGFFPRPSTSTDIDL